MEYLQIRINLRINLNTFYHSNNGYFPISTCGRVLFSGAYLNQLNVSVIPSDWIVRSKGSTRLGASLSEEGSRAGFRNAVF